MNHSDTKIRAQHNRTIVLSSEQQNFLTNQCVRLSDPVDAESLKDVLIHQDLPSVIPLLPTRFIDLLYIDPPYNLTKKFNNTTSKELYDADYATWFESWFVPLLCVLKDNASIYVCADWRTSSVIYPILERNLIVRNRITWEREKGRGAMRNRKNCSEDIWFCTRSETYVFHAEAVRVKRRVIASYRQNGVSKDWQTEENGDSRLTAPSNLWTDITVPFWSMPENTDHPTQKPEKLVAKSILGSTNLGDFVLDSFAGSGTTCVVAKKLGRHLVAVEIDDLYCALAQKRLHDAVTNNSIQGYDNGVFYERNSQPTVSTKKTEKDLSLF